MTSDIPGAQPQVLAGRSSSGQYVADTYWPYAVGGLIKDEEELFESALDPHTHLPPRRPARMAQVELEIAGIARSGPELGRPVGRCTFDERVFRSARVRPVHEYEGRPAYEAYLHMKAYDHAYITRTNRSNAYPHHKLATGRWNATFRHLGLASGRRDVLSLF